MKNFESNIKYDEKAKRCKVELPWKLEAWQLKDNREIAEKSFTRLRKRFQTDPHLFLEYREREVIRKDRPSSQLRIVYDASSHDANSLSLNSCLHIVPNLYPEIFDILLRFRLNEEDRDVTKVLFSNHPSNESQLPSVYGFTRVLSGRIFDPIGFLGSFALRIKYLMQKVWLLDVEWDESLPDDINSLWADWCEEVPQLTDFSIPRCYFSDLLVNNFKTLELHLFSDASTKAYGTVSYRVTSSNKEILTSFVASKNRIAPLKTLTLSRLELMGALL
ncbi:uncharacterized protein TNIN_66531 [Trichonephila inaurata madagascariensis]|uniref:Uncharacterized protein n=1 Tax=Trichonephila inaurata madagascariensis TaxID=2747483 RepID=A0A8X6JLC1_9ARAC|nr:uncharacterized protein TNIN_66531 [Trichonephila inaurata madagascariensis]